MKLPQIEISVKFKGAKTSELKQIRSSFDLYEILGQMFDQGGICWQEEMILICMSTTNKVIGYQRISMGGTSGTFCDPKIIFTIALNCPGTTQIIISHNHPSGSLNPSRADELTTQKILQAGKLLDITLSDHIIYTSEGYYSFRDSGKLY